MTDRTRILDALARPDDTYACLRAIDEAAALALREAVPPLIALVDHGADEWLLAASARALGTLGGEDAVRALVELLARRLDGAVRPYASAAVAPEQLGAYAVAAVQALSEERDVVLAAAAALEHLGDPRAADILRRGVLAECHDAALRAACWRALRALEGDDRLERVHVELGASRPHERESARAWLYRLVDEPITDRPLELALYDGARLVEVGGRAIPRAWNPLRERALIAWLRARDRPRAPAPRPGAVFLVLDGADDWERALLTQKDERHPLVALRGTLTIPGGSLEPGEAPLDGCVRELYEELCATPTADELAGRLVHCAHHELSFADGEREWTYGLDVFVVRAPERAVFDRWMRSILGPPGLSEASAIVCAREELRALLASERAFGAGHEHVLARIVHSAP